MGRFPRTPHYDALVLGGGPAGAATALALGRAGGSALIVECVRQPAEKPGESLPPSVNPLLDRLGLRAPFLAMTPLACHGNRSAWGSDTLADYDFLRDPHGPGWHLDRPRFDALLLEQAVGAGAELRHGLHMRHAEPYDCGPWRVTLAGDSEAFTLTAGVVVDATGRASAFARTQGARRHHTDRLLAVTALLVPSGRPMEDSTTLVEARPDGWWYSALVPDGRLATAFLTDPDLLVGLHARTVAGWDRLLAESHHTRARVAAHGFRLVAPPRLAAAGSARLDQIAGAGWLAVGDAAATHDPLSSHGIGTALSGGMKAAAAVQAQIGGDPTALPVYAERVARAYAAYLAMRRAYYAEERRWPSAPFWERRKSAPNK